MKRRTVRVWAPKLDGTRSTRFVWPAAWVASECNGARGGAVVRAIHRENLVATGVQLGETHCILGGLGTTIGEKNHV